MNKRQITAAMELLLFVSLCLLTFTGKTFSDGNGIDKIRCKEDEDVILPCSFKETLNNKRFDWKKDGKDVFLCENGKVSSSSQDEYFKGRVSHFPDQLNSGNASIRIKKAKLSDSGTYTCLNIDSAKSYNIQLIVGTCPMPIISTHHQENGGTWVECEVRGAYPEPKMELQNSAYVTVDAENTKISQNGSYFDIILQAVVTKTDYYHCVVTQKEICHQIFSKKTKVHITSDVCPKPTITIAEKTNAGMLVKCSVPGEAEVKLFNSANKSVLAGTLQPPDYFFTVTKEDQYRCVATQKDDCHQIFSDKTFVPFPGAGNGLISSGVGVCIIFAVVAAAAAIF